MVFNEEARCFSGTPFFESGRGSSLLVLETNRADIVTAKVTDCEQHETSCSLTITVQVPHHICFFSSCCNTLRNEEFIYLEFEYVFHGP